MLPRHFIVNHQNLVSFALRLGTKKYFLGWDTRVRAILVRVELTVFAFFCRQKASKTTSTAVINTLNSALSLELILLVYCVILSTKDERNRFRGSEGKHFHSENTETRMTVKPYIGCSSWRQRWRWKCVAGHSIFFWFVPTSVYYIWGNFWHNIFTL